MINCCNCPGIPGQLLGPMIEALAYSLLSINEANNFVIAACFDTLLLNISLYSIVLLLMFGWLMTSHVMQCS